MKPPVIEKENGAEAHVITLGSGAGIGRLACRTEEAAALRRAGESICIFLDTQSGSVAPLQSARDQCHVRIEFQDGEYWVVNPAFSPAVQLNGTAFRRRKLIVDDRLLCADGFLFRFDGAHLVRVPQWNGARIEAHHATRIYARRDWQPAWPPLKVSRIEAAVDASLVIEPGEFIGLIGPSGSGKSTLLKMLGGAVRPTSGTVLIDGNDIFRNRLAASLLVGMVPQDDIVHGELTVEQAIGYAARLRLPGFVRSSPRTSLVNRVISDLGLWERRFNRVDELSGGQRKRVSIAVEMMKETGALFLDEPSSGLDPATERKLMGLLQELSRKGRTVVCTTHVLDHIQMFTRIGVMSRGRLVFLGTLKECLAKYQIRHGDVREVYDRLESDVPDGTVAEKSGGCADAEAGSRGPVSYFENGRIVRLAAGFSEQQALKLVPERGEKVILDFTGCSLTAPGAMSKVFHNACLAAEAGGELIPAGAEPAALEEFDELVRQTRYRGIVRGFADLRSALSNADLGAPLGDAPGNRSLVGLLITMILALLAGTLVATILDYLAR